MKQVQSDVEKEPQLQPINKENINDLTGDDRRPDIRVKSVWRNWKTHSLIFALQTLTQTLRITYQQPVL